MKLSTSTKKVSVSNLPKKKQLGFMSCILVVVGACIGAGIFFKNGTILDNTQSIILAIVCWLIAAVGVIAMALCLTEIVSGQKEQSNLGIAAWVKTFNSKYLYNSCKNFFAYMYTPIILVALSYYVVQSICLGTGIFLPWWVIVIIALAILFWFYFTSGLSVRFFNVQNWIIMSVKFIPIVFALGVGFVYVATGHNTPNNWLPSTLGPSVKDPYPLFAQLSPICGIIASIPAIFFAFNGFTYPANLARDMKEPKKLPLTMTLGLIIVTVIYVGISVSMLISSSNGGMSGSTLVEWLPPWLYTIIYVLIAVGILSVINGTVTTGVKVYQDLIESHQVVLSHKFDFGKKFNGKPMSGVLYGLILTLIFFILCTVIGLFFSNTGKFEGFDAQTAGIFSFSDIMSNWDVLFIFMFIGVAILGCLINRKTNKVKVTKTKIFKPAAWVSLILLGVSIVYLVISVFADVGLSIYYVCTADGYGNTQVLSTVLSAIMLIAYVAVIFGISFITERMNKNKH